MSSRTIARVLERHCWRRWLVAVVVAATALAGLAGVAASAEPEPEPDFCLHDTTGSLSTTSASSFGADPIVSWQFSKGCSTVRIKFGSEVVTASGSRTVDPGVTTRYSLVASYRGASRTLARQTIVAGDVLGYTAQLGILEDSGSGAPAVNTQSRTMLQRLSETDRSRMIGKVLEVHIIPANVPVTQLPAFKHLAGQKTFDGRPFEEIRGGGGVLLSGTSRVAMFIGAEQMVPEKQANMFTHEMGHTVLDFLMHHVQAEQAYDTRVVAAGPWPGPYDAYAASNVHEYWAEGTTAWFEAGLPSAGYTKAWLQTNDPALFEVLTAVYDGQSTPQAPAPPSDPPPSTTPTTSSGTTSTTVPPNDGGWNNDGGRGRVEL